MVQAGEEMRQKWVSRCHYEAIKGSAVEDGSCFAFSERSS
jgi:hypothetical protein